MKIVTSTLALLIPGVLMPLQAQAQHIIMLVADDLGMGDTTIGVKDSDIPTPNLEALAAEGILFDIHTQPVCSPSRTSYMTGLFPFRVGMQNTLPILTGSRQHVPTDVKMIPELLEDKYESHHLGKWHLGYADWEYTPTFRGFDSSYGYFQGAGDYYEKTVANGYDFFENGKVKYGVNGTYSLNQYMGKYEQILKDYDTKYPDREAKLQHPIFVHFAHQIVHTPIQVGETQPACAGIEHQERRKYCEMVVSLDDSIKQTVEALKSYNMYDDSLILFTTDNGGDPVNSAGYNGPLRGGKASMFQGGILGTALIAGGAVPAGSRGTSYGGLCHLVDLNAIILSYAGVKPEGVTDGINLLPAMLDLPGARERQVVPINIIERASVLTYSAIRFGDYKLIIGLPVTNPRLNGWYSLPFPTYEAANDMQGMYYLFDISKDPNERDNLADQNPQLIQRGLGLIKSYMEEGYVEPQLNVLDPKALPQFHDGVWAPFL